MTIEALRSVGSWDAAPSDSIDERLRSAVDGSPQLAYFSLPAYRAGHPTRGLVKPGLYRSDHELIDLTVRFHFRHTRVSDAIHNTVRRLELRGRDRAARSIDSNIFSIGPRESAEERVISAGAEVPLQVTLDIGQVHIVAALELLQSSPRTSVQHSSKTYLLQLAVNVAEANPPGVIQ